MTQNILIAGSGFAGTWAALAAARALELANRQHDIRVLVVSPAPHMVIRPRLYETAFEEMAPDVGALFTACGIEHRAGTIETIDASARSAVLRAADGTSSTLTYDRLVLATGSHLFRPPLPGLAEHAFDVDQLESAIALERHLQTLTTQPDSPARNTIVVAGGGFTGIETACEMPQRLRAVLGAGVDIRVVLLEQAAAVGPDLGPGPRPEIEAALAACGVEVITGEGAAQLDAEGLTTSSGRRLASHTVIWTAGARAHALAAQIPGEHDRYGRVHADAFLRAPEAPAVFVTGDTAHAATDDDGHVAAMSCQHALSLGRVAGYNAAADLVGLPLHPYSQPKYVTCLDLGPWGAVFTEGWDRQVLMRQEVAKATKREINTKWIYPPAADREAAFAIANPDFVIVP